jgi:ATP-dependent DNA helicase DinG
VEATSSIAVAEHDPEALGVAGDVLARFVASTGPLAIVDLETTGLQEDPEAELLEFGAVLVDPGAERLRTVHLLVRPRRPLPRAIARITGLSDADLAGAPPIASEAPILRELLAGRLILAHNAEFERWFLSRFVATELGTADYLDTLDLLAVTHPDAPDLRLESFTRMMLGSEERHRALDDALDTARVVSAAGRGAAAGESRFRIAARALETFAPDSPWLALLGKEDLFAPYEEPSPYVAIGETSEVRVPFELEAIGAALRDEARGRRHFPGYRVREEQVRLALRFARNLADDEVLLMEGGTGVGKSLAYLAAAIPFAVSRAEAGERAPVVISTRTKLLQDQLLGKDIGAAARFLGYPDVRALSIKGRANYVCARRLAATQELGRDPGLFPERRSAHAVLEACARTRAWGEVGTVPAALVRRYPALRELLRRSVAPRAELCTREQCAGERWCPLGRRRAALAKAHLIVANHDLLLRWPPDYPSFEHAIVDEVHELAEVADEAFALEVRPDGVLDRFDELYGRSRPGERTRRGNGIVPLGTAAERNDVAAWRRALDQDLRALGRALLPETGDFGDVQLPDAPGPQFTAARALGDSVAARLDQAADHAEAKCESTPPLDRALADLRGAADTLRVAMAGERPEAVASFEGVEAPFDRWRLAVRLVSPADAFHKALMQRLRSFAGVSASLFVNGDAFAALGTLEIEERAGERLQRDSVPSPFPYATHMRVVALRPETGDLAMDTAAVLYELGRRLGGRTLGLFTSLRRMDQVAEELAPRFRRAGIELLAPRRASDDPAALVTRFTSGGAVLLGARKFWQGLDIPGDNLQAVVIEKLPFEVPTELRRRREQGLQERGIDAFGRYTLGKMLLYLKQMSGRLIRGEEDRGLVVIVEPRIEKSYFRRLGEALPPGVPIVPARLASLPDLLRDVGILEAEGDPR